MQETRAAQAVPEPEVQTEAQGAGVQKTASCGLNSVFPKFMPFQEPQHVALLGNGVIADVTSYIKKKSYCSRWALNAI